MGKNFIDLFKLKRNFLTSLKDLFEHITLPKLSPVGDLISYCLYESYSFSSTCSCHPP